MDTLTGYPRSRSFTSRTFRFLGKAMLVFLALMVLGGLLSLLDNHEHGNVGLVKVEGLIGSAQPTIEQLIKFREDDDIKAILLRIDSPGGPITPAQEIYAEIVKTTAKKPVIVSMGSVAASGGYYIAAPATKIVANPSSITGSIGVIMQHFIVEDIARKLNLRWETIKAGEVKDMGTPFRSLTYKERTLLTNLSKEMHEQFIRDIAEGRKMKIEDVRALATGEVFSGEQALKLKLVDELGSQQHALEVAGKLAHIKGKPKLAETPERKDFFDYILDRFFNRGESSRFAQQLMQSLYSTNMQLPMALMP